MLKLSGTVAAWSRQRMRMRGGGRERKKERKRERDPTLSTVTGKVKVLYADGHSPRLTEP